MEKVILAKPKTYMNNSGLAVKLVTSYWRLEPSDVWIVHDDIDLPLGSLKIRFGGAAAGHHGVESIIAQLKTDKFWRFRMGTGLQNQKSRLRQGFGGQAKFRIQKNVEDYVLSRFTGGQWGKTRELIKRGSKALQTGLEEGLEKAMNRFNTK
ncbi:MAG: peptidyl-tRNA hydrolase, partial [Candidatus Levybacteria bacterium]|nr:peptidyl-tRNA hydrolase [Candidatus Levybacteria bacterium]